MGGGLTAMPHCVTSALPHPKPLRMVAHYLLAGAGSKTDREAVGTTDSRFYYPYSGGCAALHRLSLHGWLARWVGRRFCEPNCSGKGLHKLPALAGAAGFVGVSVGGQRMTVDFFTLEGGTTPAYSATIALHTPSTKG